MTILDWLFGRPLASGDEEEQRIGTREGVPMLGLDGLASAAYGPEAALTILIPLGVVGLGVITPITILIVILLGILYVSYRQTVSAYPTGGGSYTVAKENLGRSAGLLAAAALMIDYVLTVAVGISAGVGALVSAVPSLHPYMLWLCLLVLGLIAMVNLRGVRESGMAFMIPTYLFIVMMLGILGYGIWKVIVSGGEPVPVEPLRNLPAAEQAIGVWVVMKAFASGCTAMTGVEAVSNGVMSFKEPRVVYAHRTLTIIIAVLAILLLGIAYLCRVYGIAALPDGENYESVLSQLIAAIVGRGVIYYVAIGSVLAVLCLSANTGFADFPRLCRAIASDGYLPRGFAHRGRRLVYTQGIFVLTFLSAALLIAFGGVTDNLIPLYAVGAFLAFSLSQVGMVQHWRKTGGKSARFSMVINGLGAIGTTAALIVVLLAKFTEGAWVTVALLTILAIAFYGVRSHYRVVAKELASREPLHPQHLRQPLVVVLVRGWSRITRKAVGVAMRLSSDVYALHIAYDDDQLQRLEDDWTKFVAEPCREANLPAPKLVVIPEPFRRLYTPLVDFVAGLEKTHPDRYIAVVIPELVEKRWYHYLLHNQTAAVIKGYLYFSGMERVTVVNVPWYLTTT